MIKRFWTTYQYDIGMILALIVLWWVFFFFIFTPVVENKVLLVEGDFYYQFVIFCAY